MGETTNGDTYLAIAAELAEIAHKIFCNKQKINEKDHLLVNQLLEAKELALAYSIIYRAKNPDLVEQLQEIASQLGETNEV